MRLGSDFRTVRHFWYDSWPDHGVPGTAEPLLEMMQLAEDWETSAEALGRPWTVHCSAGIGRTGAFLAIDLGVRKLEQGEEINVIDIIRCGGLQGTWLNNCSVGCMPPAFLLSPDSLLDLCHVAVRRRHARWYTAHPVDRPCGAVFRDERSIQRRARILEPSASTTP